MKLSSPILTTFKLLALILMAFSAFSTVTALPIPKTSTANMPTAISYGSFRDITYSPPLPIPNTSSTNSTTAISSDSSQNVTHSPTIEIRKHKSAPYYLAPDFGINMSQDRHDFVPGSLHEVEPRGGAVGPLYRDIMYYEQGTLRLKSRYYDREVLIPNTWFCDAKRNKAGCIGANFINPNDAILHAADPNLNLTYWNGHFAFLSTDERYPAYFEKVTDDRVNEMYRYLPPGVEPWNHPKYLREHTNRPLCVVANPDLFGVTKKLCDAYNAIRKKQGL